MMKRARWSIDQHSIVGWKDLHEDVLGMIFEKLDRKCLFESAYPVCRWWREVSRPMLFRKKMNMLDFKGLKVKDVDDVEHFMSMLKLILDGLQRKAVSIFNFIFPEYLYLSDQHLCYLVERLPKLVGVHLPCTTDMITPLGFSRVIQVWSELRTFSFGSIKFSDYTHIIKEISVSCKNLMSLFIDGNDMGTKKGSTFVLNGETSLLIASYLPNLQGLGFSKCVLYKTGLKNIMSKCKRLHHFVLKECKHVNSLVDPAPAGYYLVYKVYSKNKWLTMVDDNQSAYLREARFSTSSMVNLLWRFEGHRVITRGAFG